MHHRLHIIALGLLAVGLLASAHLTRHTHDYAERQCSLDTAAMSPVELRFREQIQRRLEAGTLDFDVFIGYLNADEQRWWRGRLPKLAGSSVALAPTSAN